MNNLKLLALIFIFALTSCTKKNVAKTYKYTSTVEWPAILGVVNYKDGATVNVSAINDSIAYCEGYRNYCIEKKYYAECAIKFNRYMGSPVAFKLINDMGEDIVNTVDFIGKSRIELKIEEEVEKMPNSLK